MANTNAEFVFVGNTTYDTINDKLEASKGTLRVGPVLDPHTGEYRPEWEGMNLIGMYVMNKDPYIPGEATIVEGRDRKPITLERTLQKVFDKTRFSL